MAKNLALIWKEIFYFFSWALIIAFLLELFWPKIILVYFNLNYLVILWLVSALIILFKKQH